MKNYVVLPKEKGYFWPSEYTNRDIYSLMRLITDYGDSSLTIQKSLNLNERGLALGCMEYDVKGGFVHIKPLYMDDDEYELIIPLITFKFLIDKWIEIKALKPDIIIISEEDGKYSISAEFKAPTESTQEAAK